MTLPTLDFYVRVDCSPGYTCTCDSADKQDPLATCPARTKTLGFSRDQSVRKLIRDIPRYVKVGFRSVYLSWIHTYHLARWEKSTQRLRLGFKVGPTLQHPIRIDPWIGAPDRMEIDIYTRRNRFGQFIGLQIHDPRGVSWSLHTNEELANSLWSLEKSIERDVRQCASWKPFQLLVCPF